MNPKNSREELCNRLTAQSLSLDNFNVAQGFEAMLAFYTDCPADGCDFDDDGDMLLCQWGTSGDAFEWNITRQFMPADEEEPYQLSLTFSFDSWAAVAEADAQNKWCANPDELSDFRASIETCMFYRLVAERPATKIELVFEQC